MAQKQISRFPLNEKFSELSGLSGHVPNYGLRHVLTAAQICISPLPRCGGTVVGSQHVLPAYTNLYFPLTKLWRNRCGLTAHADCCTNLYFTLTKVLRNRCGLTACAPSINKYVFPSYQVVAEPLWAHSIYKSVFPRTAVGLRHMLHIAQICISPLPRCGGTVVGSRHVLTAAHCVTDDCGNIILKAKVVEKIR